MSKNRITIAVSGGLATQAYSTLNPCELDIELLDFDAAKNLSGDAVERLHVKFDGVKKTCRKLSMEVNVGLPGEENADGRAAVSGV